MAIYLCVTEENGAPYITLSDFTINELNVDSDTFAQENFESYYQEIKKTVTLKGYFIYDTDEYKDVIKLIDWAILPNNDLRCYKKMRLEIYSEVLEGEAKKLLLREETFENAYVTEYNELFDYQKGVPVFSVTIKNLDKKFSELTPIINENADNSEQEESDGTSSQPSPQPSGNEKMYVTADVLNIRDAPGTNGTQVIGKAKNGAEVLLLSEEKNGWVKVQCGTEIGWVSCSYLGSNEPNIDKEITPDIIQGNLTSDSNLPVRERNGYAFPVAPGATLTSKMGWRSFGGGQDHKGTDIAGKEKIYCIYDGTVIRNYTSSSFGNTLVVKHIDPNGTAFCSLYAHMVSPSALKEGEEIKKGDFIGKQGNTGNSAGIHVHFQTYYGDAYDGSHNKNAFNALEVLYKLPNDNDVIAEATGWIIR